MKLFFICFIVLSTINIYGQTTDRAIVADLYEVDGTTGARISVNSDTPITIVQGRPDDLVKGYRVRIFSDNSQTGRDESRRVENSFKERHPYISTYLDYVSPYYRVTVGDFLTKEEAVMLWGKLSQDYPKAFLVIENMKISTFGITNKSVLQAVDENIEQVN